MDHYQKALEQLTQYGLQVELLDTSGKLQRVRVEGDTGRKKSGWYVCHEFTTRSGKTVIVGRYGNWKLGNDTRKLDADFKLDPDELAELKRQQAAAQKIIQQERERAARDAARRAAKLANTLPDTGHTAYLQRKGVRGFNVYYGKGDTLFVPIAQHGKGLVGFQIIAPDGTKKFLTGTPMQGAFHWIGAGVESNTLLIAEGYATAASLHMASGMPCFVAFNAGNLVHVARMVRQRWPNKHIIICADDDHATEGNPGLTKGNEAAAAVNGVMIQPVFDHAEGKTDFNDMHAERGLKALADFVAAAISEIETSKKTISTPHAAPLQQDDNHNSLRPPDNDEWQRGIQRNKEGTPLGNTSNVYKFLTHLDEWRGVIARDDFAGRIVCRKPPPFGGDGDRPWTDNDDIRVGLWLADNVGCSPPTPKVFEAVQIVAEDNAFHPVRDYLRANEWDGTARVRNWLIDYMGATPELDEDAAQAACDEHDRVMQYLKLAGTKFLIAAVARVMRPPVKVDTVLILEGGQGKGKSTALNILFGDWFCDTPFVLGSLDAYQTIQSKWGVELAELDSFNKATNTRTKGFFSSITDTYRESYGRRVMDHHRQCVFAGSTNQHEYLRDPSGDRRYWPVDCKKIDLEGLKRDRDQLWAEALKLYNDGVKWWPVGDEIPLFEAEQDKRRIDDPWQTIIEDYLHDPERRLHDIKITINDLLDKAIGADISRINEHADAVRVGKCLKSLGYVKRQQAKHPRRYYVKGADHD